MDRQGETSDVLTLNTRNVHLRAPGHFLPALSITTQLNSIVSTDLSIDDESIYDERKHVERRN
jgi:hypothetical protein